MASDLLTEASVRKLRVADLKKRLQERGLDSTGVKATLQRRLLNALQQTNTEENHNDAPVSSHTTTSADLTDTAAASTAATCCAGAPTAAPHDNSLLNEGSSAAEVKQSATTPETVPTAEAAPTSAAGPPATAAPTSDASATTKATKPAVGILTEEDRRLQRAARFGTEAKLPEVDVRQLHGAAAAAHALAPPTRGKSKAKKRSRSGSGSSSSEGAAAGAAKDVVLDLHDEAVQRRLKRFGEPHGDNTLAVAYRAAQEQMKMDQRKERFAAPTKIAPASALCEEAKMEARRAKFAAV